MEQSKALWTEKELDLRDAVVFLWNRILALLIGAAVVAAGLPILEYFKDKKAYAAAKKALMEGEKLKVSPASFEIKNVILGFVLGFILVAAVLLVVYLLNRRIKTAGELQGASGLLLLGTAELAPVPRWEGKIRKLLYGKKKTTPEEDEQTLCARIAAVCRKRGVQQVLIAGETGPEQTEYLQKLAKRLAENGITAEPVGDPASDPAAIARMETPENLILAVAVKKNTYDQLAETVRFCRWQGAELLGYIALQ